MAGDMFLQIDGIPGESTDENHPLWIEILSFTNGVSQPDGGARAGKSPRPSFTRFDIVKLVDTASVMLARALVENKGIPVVRLEVCRAAGEKTTYLSIEFKECYVESYNITGVGDDQNATLPRENVTLSFAEIHFIYTGTDHKTGRPLGDVTMTWNLQTNTGG